MEYGWAAPDGLRSVRLRDEVVSSLRQRVLEALQSLPKRGVEVGGLLLGRFAGRDPLQAVVESFAEIECEHRYGPSYVLSETDFQRLDKIMERLENGRAIGFFRSYTGRAAVLEDADLELLRNRFGGPPRIFLLLRPERPKDCHAAFLFWTGGELPFEPECPEFAFDPAQMRVEAPTAPRVPPPVVPAKKPAAEPSREPPAARGHFWLPLAACLLLSIGSAIGYELWRGAAGNRWALLPLDGHPTAEGFELDWDRSAPPAVDASRGVLTISDGTHESRIELGQFDIRQGKFAYPSSRPDVMFRLELRGDRNEMAAGSLRIVKTLIPVAAPPPSLPEPRVEERARSVPDTETVATGAPGVLHQVQPTIPAGILARIDGRVVVPVRVQLNPLGEVIAAVPQAVDSGNDVYRYLAHRSAEAARHWRFSPHAAKSRTLSFVFTSDGSAN